MPVFLMREGEFYFGGDRRSLLTISPYGVMWRSEYHQDADVESLQPINSFAGASLSVSASLVKDAIQLQYLFVSRI